MAVKWNDKPLRKMVEDKAKRNMIEACKFLESYIKHSISGPSPSAPGEPPGVITGTFRRSIAWEIDEGRKELIGRIGTNLIYALPLEFGTSKMAARPWARPALEKNKSKIAKTLGKK